MSGTSKLRFNALYMHNNSGKLLSVDYVPGNLLKGGKSKMFFTFPSGIYEEYSLRASASLLDKFFTYIGDI